MISKEYWGEQDENNIQMNTNRHTKIGLNSKKDSSSILKLLQNRFKTSRKY